MCCQSKFIADRSPFYWVLAGSDSAARHLKIPPLLTMFLEVCTSLSEETQEEIMDVLLKINQDTLLKQLCARLPHIPMASDQPRNCALSLHFQW
ncbi:hypothetical protein FA13DRAFT_1401853 [Coprinellus micaceus]|uniref:Uncharacterized protein n=1 Tax=Coprinellus micaceus TaxID=71717 RepID=A0A4Y7SQ26_COPMI|nr:hypothetical protein FA13DRAFT_1401853 [Coprinellus micaceus]